MEKRELLKQKRKREQSQNPEIIENEQEIIQAGLSDEDKSDDDKDEDSDEDEKVNAKTRNGKGVFRSNFNLEKESTKFEEEDKNLMNKIIKKRKNNFQTQNGWNYPSNYKDY